MKLINKTAARTHLQLVSFRKELFPLQPEDYELIRSRGISVARMPSDAFPILQRTFLKGVTVEVKPWPSVFQMLMEHFKDSFDKDLHEFLSDGNRVMIHSATIEKPILAAFASRLELLSLYLGRYGFRLRSEQKIRKQYTLTRLIIVPDSELVPSFYFGSGESLASETKLVFHTSPSCRIRFTRRLSPSGQVAFNTVFEDKVGDGWSETLSRSFNFSYLNPADCASAIDFFSNILSQVNSFKRKK